MIFELNRDKMEVPEKAKDIAMATGEFVNLIAWAVEEFTDDEGNIFTDAMTVGSAVIAKLDTMKEAVEFFEKLKTGKIALSAVDVGYAIFASEVARPTVDDEPEL